MVDSDTKRRITTARNILTNPSYSELYERKFQITRQDLPNYTLKYYELSM